MSQIGFVGLGKMGGNMVARIKRDSDHDVVAFDFDDKAVEAAVKKGAVGAKSLRELVRKLDAPRMVWIMVPAGEATQKTVDQLAKLLDKGDMIIDGGNSKWTDDKARAAALRKLGIDYVDVGTSGGVWGLQVGYCMMAGGPNKAIKRLAPILDVLAPPPTEEHGPGWGHFGPSGAGHYVKMVHNGIEYGLMQAYAEGFDLFDKSEYELDNAKIAHLWNQGERRALVALRARRDRLRAERQRPRRPLALHRRLRRGPLDDRGRDGQGRADAGDHRRAAGPLLLARQRRVHPQGAGRAAPAVRRPRGPEASRRVSGENPLVEGLERLPVHPTTLTIFGATGDLAKRKLLPALYNLAHDGALPERFNLIGISRSDNSHEDYATIAEEAIREFSRRDPDEDVLKALLEHVRYLPGTFDDAAVYERLAQTLAEFDTEAGQALNRAFYLSTAPEFFPVIVEQLGAAGLDAGADDTEVRVIIEKPFGTTLEEAKDLNQRVLSVFAERQIFRIDHYLGKETVQNMMAFRFANGLFEPVWNRNYIDNVQITVAEDIGIGTRAGYYDSAGALRDLVQNHMLQLLCHVAMEPPVEFSADEVRNEKVKVLHAIRAPTADEVDAMAVRAQYAAGTVGGEDAGGYLEEDGVPADSNTETYAALRLEIDNWRWAGVPFYLRTGKRLARKVTEIAVTLQPVPHLAFKQEGSVGVQPNQLVLTLQPNEGVSLSLGAKIPGTRMRHPAGEHGVPLRDRLPLAVARGLRAADHGRDARRRDALHPQRRGRGAVAHLRPDRLAVGGDPRAAAPVRGRVAGPGRGRRAAASATTSGGRSDRLRRGLERA